MTTRTTPGHFRLFYVDDSGSPDGGLIVYGWLECPAHAWRTTLTAWLDLRRHLWTEYGIPVSYELHSANFAGGHGNPSIDPSWNRRKHLRSEVMQVVLAHIASTPDLHIGTVYRATQARRHIYAAHRADLYRNLVTNIDTRVGAAGELGLIFMDGDGTDPTYVSAHRALPLGRRHIIEDPQFQSSHQSHWLQMADIVAWTTYQHLHRAPTRKFAWDWYTEHLQARDTHGWPVTL